MRDFRVHRVHVDGFKTERCDTAECRSAHSFEIHEYKDLFGKNVEFYRGLHETEEQAQEMIRQLEA